MFSAPPLDYSKLPHWLLQQLLDKVPLIEAFLIAVSIHVLLFPVVWMAGWLLPWPKTPVVTTVVEFDLRNWPLEAKQKKFSDVRDPKLNK
jgi:hypothetical protein